MKTITKCIYEAVVRDCTGEEMTIKTESTDPIAHRKAVFELTSTLAHKGSSIVRVLKDVVRTA